jgi:2,3-bisphosphoglycerate-dependent phosphoglycerate mutase
MVMTSELVIVRHGEAACNAAGVAGGERGCTGLTERGRHQARSLAERLAAEHAQRPFDTFHTTPRLRARQTADEISARLGLPPTVEVDLRGPDHGDADGQPWHHIRAAFGGNPRRYPDRPYAPGSETWNQYLRRVGSALRAVLDRNAGRRVLIAGHRETVEAAHTLLLGLPPGSCVGLGFITGHACLARWQHHVDRYGQAVWKLAAHNDGWHLTR